MSSAPEARPYPPLSDSVFESLSLKGKMAVICGGASGIGYQVARAYAEAGANVAIIYNSNAAAITKAEQLGKEFGTRVAAYQCTVTDAQEVETTVKQIFNDFGSLDVFVANAGAGKAFKIAGSDVSDWHSLVDVNLNGVYYCARAVGTIFEAQGSGNFIITSSMSAVIANLPVVQSCYSATKAAVSQFAKCLALEWKQFARVNTVSPGYMDTDMGIAAAEAKWGSEAIAAIKKQAYTNTALGRDGDPRELKGAYLYLASNASSYTTGTDIMVDGGYTAV